MKHTPDEMLAIARKGRPNVRYTLNASRNAIAAWSNELGRWVAVAALAVTGEWYEVPAEMLVNGEPVFPQSIWLPE